VEITDLHASCGCTTPRIARRIYQPGEQGALLVEVNTLSQPAGQHIWRVQVYSRSGDRSSEVSLDLAATVVTEVMVEPASVTVYTDSAIGQEIVVTDLRAQPFAVTGVRATAPGLTPRLGDLHRDEAGHWARTIQMEVAGDYPEGRHEETVAIYTDDPRYPELKMPVTIVKRSRERLSATPSQVTLTAPSGQPVPSRIVLIHDRDNQPVIVDRAEADDPAVGCQWAAGPDSLATVKIKVDRRQVHTDSLHTVVHVHVSKPVDQTLTIPVSCLLP
jgi:hypothetical protein